MADSLAVDFILVYHCVLLPTVGLCIAMKSMLPFLCVLFSDKRI